MELTMALGPVSARFSANYYAGEDGGAKSSTFVFGVRGLPQTGLSRSIEYRWRPQERIGRPVAQQFLGPGEETVSLRGIIYPPYFGSFNDLEKMRAEGNKGLPRGVVTSYGRYYGKWCIRNIRDEQSLFWPNGLPRKVEFTIDLVSYGADSSGGFSIF